MYFARWFRFLLRISEQIYVKKRYQCRKTIQKLNLAAVVKISVMCIIDEFSFILRAQKNLILNIFSKNTLIVGRF